MSLLYTKADYHKISLRVLSGQLVVGLHERNSHPLDSQLRSQIQWSKKSEPPWKGEPAMTMRKQKDQGNPKRRRPKLALAIRLS